MALAGIGCILWGYHELFAVTLEKAVINNPVVALTSRGEISGKAAGSRSGVIFIASASKIEEVPLHNIIRVGKTSLLDFETRRAVTAVCISSAGGFAVWIAIFFL